MCMICNFLIKQNSLFQKLLKMILTLKYFFVFIILFFYSCQIVACVCLTEEPDYSVNYAQNGDFQTPYLGPNKYRFTTNPLSGWTANKIEQGTGSIYNSNWGSNTQVIELDTDKNQQYNQTLVLPKSKFLFKISYAARKGRALNSSGMILRWNGVIFRNIPVSLDYNIHTQTFVLDAIQGANLITVEGAGIPDGGGMTCDNIVFNKINSYNRVVDTNGLCVCDTGYFDDMINWNCQPCASVQPACQKCTYQKITNSTNYIFECQQCGYGFYVSTGTCMNCSVNHPGCLNCSNDGDVCYSCDESENYFYDPHLEYFSSTNSNISNNSMVMYCTLCSLEGCITCNSLENCSVCNNSNNYFINDTTSLCQPCILEGCVECIDLMNCLICDYNNSYYFPNTSSVTCEYCDRNYNQFVNLSSLMCEQCVLDDCFQCSNLTACEVCVSGLFVLNQTSLLCDPCLLQGCLHCITQTSCKICDNQNEYNLVGDQCVLCLSCICREGGAIQSKAVPDLLYTEQECQRKNEIKSLTDVIAYSSYIIMFLSLVSIKIVGLELFGVLQLAYFNLSDHDFINLYLSPLLSWRFLNGFNLNLGNYINSPNSVPSNVEAIEYGSSFVANINVMFFVLVVELLIGLILTVLSYKFKKLQKVGKFFLQQIFITLFLFNSFNIAYSAGLHFKYANEQNTKYYFISTIMAVIGLSTYLTILFFLQMANKDEFGEYKQKFKKDCVNQMYMSVSVIYRMALGTYMAVSNEDIYGTLIILAFSLIYIMYNVTNLPFVDAYQNYRANLCHLTQVVILLITNYYRSMKHNYPLEAKARMHTPAIIELVLLVTCVIVSFVCLIYEIYKTIKSFDAIKAKMRKFLNSKLNKIQNIQTNPTQNPQISYETMNPNQPQILTTQNDQ